MCQNRRLQYYSNFQSKTDIWFWTRFRYSLQFFISSSCVHYSAKYFSSVSYFLRLHFKIFIKLLFIIIITLFCPDFFPFSFNFFEIIEHKKPLIYRFYFKDFWTFSKFSGIQFFLYARQRAYRYYSGIFWRISNIATINKEGLKTFHLNKLINIATADKAENKYAIFSLSCL